MFPGTAETTDAVPMAASPMTARLTVDPDGAGTSTLTWTDPTDPGHAYETGADPPRTDPKESPEQVTWTPTVYGTPGVVTALDTQARLDPVCA